MSSSAVVELRLENSTFAISGYYSISVRPILMYMDRLNSNKVVVSIVALQKKKYTESDVKFNMVYCEVPMRHSFNLTSFHCHHFYSCSRYCKIVQRRIIFSQNTFQDLVFSPQNFVFNPQHRRLFTFKQIDVKGEL